MTIITLLAPDRIELTGAITTLVNDGYHAAERDMWAPGVRRSTTEESARAQGARQMQLEMLAPTRTHPHIERLLAWYGALGYREIERRPLAAFDPDARPLYPLDVRVMRRML